MIRLAQNLIANLKVVPETLRIAIIGSMVLAVALIFTSIIPGWEVQGSYKISLSELWSDYTGISMLLGGVTLILLSIMTFQRKSWVRHIYMLFFIFSAVQTVHEITTACGIDYFLIAFCIVTLLIPAHYFYINKSVKNFFETASD